jgi:hypothetical protein
MEDDIPTARELAIAQRKRPRPEQDVTDNDMFEQELKSIRAKIIATLQPGEMIEYSFDSIIPASTRQNVAQELADKGYVIGCLFNDDNGWEDVPAAVFEWDQLWFVTYNQMSKICITLPEDADA